MMRAGWLILLVLACMSAGQTRGAAALEAWPVVRPFEMSVGLRMNGPRLDLNVPLYGEAGDILYRLICRGGDDERRAELGALGASYLWPMTCMLNLGDRETDLSLLSEDHAAAYFSRGAVYDHDLMICGDYPEYGRLRHFRLRGFELTLQFSDLVITPVNSDKVDVYQSPLDYAVLAIKIRPDATITSAKVELTGYLHPTIKDGVCSEVRLGNEPRMCRSKDTFSWEECPEGFANERFEFEAWLEAQEATKNRR